MSNKNQNKKIEENEGIVEVFTKFFKNNFEILIISFISGIILMLIVLTSFNIYIEKKQIESILKEKEKLIQAQNYWKSVSSRYPDYKDAYLQHALVSYKLGESENVKLSLEKALRIDPEYREAIELMQGL